MALPAVLRPPALQPGAGTGLPAPDPVVSPLPSQNQVDAVGQVTSRSTAKLLLEGHQKALSARRQRDLLSEKFLLHIDGSADFQWADIVDGQRVEIPRLVSDYRKTENLLRTLVDNAVAHHTTMELEFFAQTNADRRSKEKALLDSLWINDLALKQDFNGLFAEALYMAMPAGFCPVHAYWREDALRDWHESVSPGPDPGGVPMRGMIDCWVGNPFGTVFDVGAKRNSVRWCSYERTLSADLVRQKFGHIPGVSKLEGGTRRPSATEFQTIARQWLSGGLGLHGSPVLTERRDDEELMTIVVRETAPGVLGANDPGRLQIIIVPGEIDLRRTSSPAHAIMAADQPLPGMDWSFENFYSHHRGSDIHGKPWIEDLDQLQIDLNIALSKRWEAINRQFDAPIVTPGGAISDDLADLDGYAILELEPSASPWRPSVMEWPQSILLGLDKEIEERRRSMWTIGGYQAASRGESPGSRTPFRAIALLQQADNTIHGPVNQKFQRSACNFARRCHSQFKFYGDIPWVVTVMGDDYAHLAAPYIDATQLSDEPPNYVLVNAFGSSPDLRTQEVIDLMQVAGADGQPLISTEEARRLLPNRRMFGTASDAAHIKRRRAKAVAAEMNQMAADLRKQNGFQETDPMNPMVAKAAQWVFMMAEQKFKRLRDDDLQAHIDAYSEYSQDLTVDPIAREAIGMRQELYYQWQAIMSTIPMAGATGGGPGASGPPQRSSIDQRSIAAEGQKKGGGGAQMTQTQEA